ncbi:hypothetical protein [Pseudomonas abietaniphila]|nr:hypothetical protein [Pseudomonas abietaniphila]
MKHINRNTVHDSRYLRDTRREFGPPEIEAAVAITKAEAAALDRLGIPALLASIASTGQLSEATIASMGVLLSGLEEALETEVRLRKSETRKICCKSCRLGSSGCWLSGTS